MIRVKIIKEIFIRKGPGPSFKTLGSVRPGGRIIEMEGWVEGESLKSTNKWYFNFNTKQEKQFYWAGGVLPLEEFAAAAPPNSPTTTAVPNVITETDPFKKKINNFLTHGDISLHRGSANFRDWNVSWAHADLEVWKIWTHPRLPTRGENVTVTVIDAGAPKENPNLRVDATDCFYPLQDGATITDDSPNMHGCMCAGIIAGNGPRILGIAPAAKILVARTYRKDKTLSLEALRDCLKWAIEKKSDVISLSFAINQVAPEDSPIVEEIRKELVKCKENNILVTCAIGNAGAVGIPMDSVFPACEPQCIAVGGYDRQGSIRSKSTTPSSRLKYLLPAEAILTTTLTSAECVGRDTSIATPAFAGILALFVSLIKSGRVSITRNQLLQRLHDTGKGVTEKIGNTEFNYTIPQPLALLDKI